MKFGVGQSVKRVEDVRLLSGHGAFLADRVPRDALHAVVVRSQFAHARLTGVRTGAALALDGVEAVLTATDYSADGLGGIACHTLLPGLHGKVATRTVPALATDRLLYVGMPVALVVARSLAIARDAADLVEVEAEELAAMTDPPSATATDAPDLWPDAPGNVAFELDLGDAAATRAARDTAAHVVTLSLHNNRLSANALEMRGALAWVEPDDGRLTLTTSTQAPHTVRGEVAAALGLAQNRLRVIARDVGGGFGMKGGVYPEDILISWAAQRLRATVCWQADRSESLLSDYHGRDQHVQASLALDAGGKILSLEVRCDYNAGAFLSPGGGVSAMFAATLATGCYRVPVAHVLSRAIYTNTSPTQPYRGAGRPEAAYLIERLLDKAARETGRDRIEMRRINMLRADEMPYQTPLVYRIDSGDYAAVLDAALQTADWHGFDRRRAEAAGRGMLRGIGIALHMENAGLANEGMDLRLEPDGSATVLAGTFSHGQGHETVYAQMVSDWLGLPFERIQVVQGDTDRVGFGRGTVASRSMINGGASLRLAADAVIAKARAIAAHLMEVGVEDVVFDTGRLSVAGTDKAMPLTQVAALSYKPILPPELGLGLSGQGEFKLNGYTFPNGCQIAEVEVDPDTGATRVISIASVDDVGTVLNPMLLDGQMVGGIVQGLGQALMEDVIYDADGQLLTGSFMDYAMPRADDVPPISVETRATRTETNPLGVKGAGEAGTVGATPAIISALLDALSGAGVDDIALPATPLRVWTALQTAT